MQGNLADACKKPRDIRVSMSGHYISTRTSFSKFSVYSAHLVLLHTKLCDVPYAINYFQTWPQNWYFISALKLVMAKFWFRVWLDIKTYTAI